MTGVTLMLGSMRLWWLSGREKDEALSPPCRVGIQRDLHEAVGFLILAMARYHILVPWLSGSLGHVTVFYLLRLSQGDLTLCPWPGTQFPPAATWGQTLTTFSQPLSFRGQCGLTGTAT